MKQITIDTGSTSGIGAFGLFEKEGFAVGDTLRIVRRPAHSQDAWVAVMMVVLVAANYFLRKKPAGTATPAADVLVNEIARNVKNAATMRHELKSEFDVNVQVEGEVDEDREFWNRVGLWGLARAYGDDEPDISGITLLEPNPDYVPWKPEA